MPNTGLSERCDKLELAIVIIKTLLEDLSAIKCNPAAMQYVENLRKLVDEMSGGK